MDNFATEMELYTAEQLAKFAKLHIIRERCKTCEYCNKEGEE